jgi:hypothetical protein
MYKTGEFIQDSLDFDQKNWGARTAEYVSGIRKIDGHRWSAILDAVQKMINNTPSEKDYENVGDDILGATGDHLYAIALPPSDPF